MSTGRVLWIIWCGLWVAIWFFMGFATLGLTWLLAVVSAFMVLLPVGKGRERAYMQEAGQAYYYPPPPPPPPPPPYWPPQA